MVRIRLKFRILSQINMKTSGQVAKKNKTNAVQANKKKVLRKGPVVKGKNAGTVPRGDKIQKNGFGKKLPSAKNGKNKKSESDGEDDEEDEEASDIDNNEESIENGNGGELVDSDSDSDNEEDEAGAQQDDNDEDSDEDDDDDEEEQEENGNNDDDNDGEDDDEAPEEAPVVKEEEKAVPFKVVNKLDYRTSTIYVTRLNPTTLGEQIVKTFESFGKIKEIKLKKRGVKNTATIIFEDEAASMAALKMHNAIIYDTNINIYHANIQRPKSSTTHSVIIKNVENLDKVESSKLEKILLQCGELDELKIICERNILAFVKFKNADSVEKALKLDGTTQNGLQICISAHTSNKKDKIFVKNIERSTTEEDLRKFFETCGPIVKITLKTHPHLPNTAVIVFEKSESYCQAFMLHEELLNGRPVLLEPLSEKTFFAHEKKPMQFNKDKRPYKGMWKGGPPQKKMTK